MSAAVQVKQLSLRYGKEQPVLDQLSFAVPASAVTLVCGPNGSGKSSLIKAIAGILDYQGEILLQGQALSQLSRAQRAQRMAYVPQRSQLQANLPVREVVAMGRFAHADTSIERNRAVDRALEFADCQALEARPYLSLSGGQQQRVLLARALATQAKVLLLDEPSAALDIHHTLQLTKQLRGLAQSGFTVLWAMHDLHLAHRCAEHCLLLANTKIVAQGPPEQVLDASSVKQVYQVHRRDEYGPSFYLEEHS